MMLIELLKFWLVTNAGFKTARSSNSSIARRICSGQFSNGKDVLRLLILILPIGP